MIKKIFSLPKNFSSDFNIESQKKDYIEKYKGTLILAYCAYKFF